MDRRWTEKQVKGLIVRQLKAEAAFRGKAWTPLSFLCSGNMPRRLFQVSEEKWDQFPLQLPIWEMRPPVMLSDKCRRQRADAGLLSAWCMQYRWFGPLFPQKPLWGYLWFQQVTEWSIELCGDAAFDRFFKSILTLLRFFSRNASNHLVPSLKADKLLQVCV